MLVTLVWTTAQQTQSELVLLREVMAAVREFERAEEWRMSGDGRSHNPQKATGAGI
jgi:hypothetical protein